MREAEKLYCTYQTLTVPTRTSISAISSVFILDIFFITALRKVAIFWFWSTLDKVGIVGQRKYPGVE
jgi:hypothetical protein